MIIYKLQLGYQVYRLTIVNAVFSDTIWYCIFAPLVFFLATDGFRTAARALDNKVLVYIGQRSYGAYVIHEIMAYFMLFRVKAVMGKPLGLYGPLEFVFYGAITLWIAVLLYRYLERPMFNLRDRHAPSLS